MTATIRSIAQAANVSRGTVDKVLNDRPGVSHEVRERVRRIAEDLGYKPNLAGKALAFRKNPLKIGVIILDRQDYLFQEVYQGVKKAYAEFKDLGVILECIVMDGVDVNEQLQCIRKLSDSNIAALALSPLDAEVIKEELIKLTARNIKIVTFNTDIAGIEKLCFVGQDLAKSGRVAGKLLGEILPGGGQAVIITRTGKIKALQQRIAGFTAIIEDEYPNIEIVETVSNVMDDDDAYIKTKEILKKYKSLKAFFLTGRGIGGAGRAIKELNRRKIKFICYDTVPETIELIKEGIIDFTITQEPFTQGYLPVKTIFQYFYMNIAPSKENLFTKLEIKTKENLDD